ncbi:MAG: WD40/YVTN/BNR-like repeat-containing protein, partial [Brevinematales bacterium]
MRKVLGIYQKISILLAFLVGLQGCAVSKGTTNGTSSSAPAPVFVWQECEIEGETSPNSWTSIASSADGTRLLACIGWPNKGYIYTSSDGGENWQERKQAGVRFWEKVASSSDGMKLVALSYEEGDDGGYIYTSSDGGSTWTKRTEAGERWWEAVDISSDGTKIIAAASDSAIYTSLDGGESWYNGDREDSWDDIALAGNGSLMGGVIEGNYLYLSTNAGTNWLAHTNLGKKDWTAISIAGDGTKIIASVYNGTLWISLDKGANWTECTSAGTREWHDVSVSSDGSTFVGVDKNAIYVSTNNGSTWDSTDVGSLVFPELAISSNGKQIAISSRNRFLQTSSDRGNTWLERKKAGPRWWGDVALSSAGEDIVAVVNDGFVYTSPNRGTGWLECGNRDSWNAIVSSDDGTRMVVINSSHVLFSLDRGTNWTVITNTAAAFPFLSMSADGKFLIAGQEGT